MFTKRVCCGYVFYVSYFGVLARKHPGCHGYSKVASIFPLSRRGPTLFWPSGTDSRWVTLKISVLGPLASFITYNEVYDLQASMQQASRHMRGRHRQRASIHSCRFHVIWLAFHYRWQYYFTLSEHQASFENLVLWKDYFDPHDVWEMRGFICAPAAASQRQLYEQRPSTEFSLP